MIAGSLKDAIWDMLRGVLWNGLRKRSSDVKVGLAFEEILRAVEVRRVLHVPDIFKDLRSVDVQE